MNNLICGIAIGSVFGAVLATHPEVRKMAKQVKGKVETVMEKSCECECGCDERPCFDENC